MALAVWRPRGRIWSAVAPPSAVVDLAAMKAHLRVEGTADDAQVTDCEAAAVLAVEKYTQRLLRRRSATLRLPGLPDGRAPVELPGGQAVAPFLVTTPGGTIDQGEIVGDAPALLFPAAPWPRVDGDGLPVQITYLAGFTVVPADLVAATKLIAADLYDRRSNGDTQPVHDVPISAHFLMMRHRIGPI
jgi:uncharacterized phiE125 gp8 family phage protein